MKHSASSAAKAWLWLIAGILAILGLLYLLIAVQKADLAGLEGSLAELKRESVPLRFQVQARAGGELSVKLKLYDADGGEISSIIRSLPGESLFIDFVSVPVKGCYLAFPQRVFTEKLAARDGPSLFPLYDKGGFPQVFASAGLGTAAKKGLSALFLKVKAGDLPRSSFGSAVHDVKELKSFELGVTYKAVSRLAGGLEIMEDAP